MGYDDEVTVRRLLRYPTWAVVGLSANPAAPDEAVAMSARGVWFHLGVGDRAASDRVRAAGIDMVMDRCPAIEWPAHGPR
jgi:predicted CoA-binding protein